MKFILFLALISLASCAKDAALAPQATAKTANEANGNEGLNGGNFEAQELGRMSGELLSVIRQSQDLFPEVGVDSLEAAVNKTKLYMVQSVVKNGQELDASNNGVNEIQVSRIRWEEKTERNSRLALLFHEYLGILGIEKDNYFVSNRLLNPVAKSPAGGVFICDDGYGTKVNLRYDFTSGFFFFKAISGSEVNREAYNRNPQNSYKYTAENWNGRAIAVWQDNFADSNLAQVTRIKSGDLLYRPGKLKSAQNSWQKMYFVDGQGFMLTNEEATRVLSCMPVTTSI